MRKIYSFFLFFTFIALFSSVAAEREPASVLTVKVKTSEMGEVIGILESNGVNLKETAFFSDFDETLATTVTTYKDHEFKFLPCPDRGRTYKQVFSAAFQGFPYSLDNFSFMALSENRYNDIHEKYAVLDQGAMDLICSLCEDAYFVGVCSALPIDGKKNDLMKYVGLDADNYIYADNGKCQAIYKFLKEKSIQSDQKITTIVLMDNSEVFAINPFLKDMPILVKGLGLTNVKIIGIEFTKFADMATKEAIKEELTILQDLHLNSGREPNGGSGDYFNGCG